MRDELLEPFDPPSAENVKQRAMYFLEKAFDDAEGEGVPPDAVAHAALFGAIATLVECFGEEAVCSLLKEIPERVMSGGYSVSRILQ